MQFLIFNEYNIKKKMNPKINNIPKTNSCLIENQFGQSQDLKSLQVNEKDIQRYPNSSAKENQYMHYQVKLLREYPTIKSFSQVQNKSPRKFLKYKYDLDNIDKYDEDYYIDAIKEIQNKQTNTLSFHNKQDISQKMNRGFGIHFNGDNYRSVVRSIIFDSKVKRQQQTQNNNTPYIINQPTNLDINSFQLKVDRMNNQIEDGISHLQEMVLELKKKKIAQRLQVIYSIQERVKSLPYQIPQQRPQNRLQYISQYSPQHKPSYKAQNQLQHKPQQYIKEEIPQSIKVDSSQNVITSCLKKQQVENQQQPMFQTIIEQQKNLENIIRQRRTIQNEQQPTKSSKILLNADCRDKQTSYPIQYSIFINLLADQILLDIQFTNLILDLNKSHQLQSIKQLIFGQIVNYKADKQVYQTFFRIQPSQIDPLEVDKPYFIIKYQQKEHQELALKVYKKYKQIQAHYETKLYLKFNISVISFLFEELAKFNFTKSKLQDEQTVTIGHLLSYLNMRTNNSFRNRSFVKMQKRLNLSSHHYLNIYALSLLVAE